MTVSFELGKFSWFCRLRFLFFICLPFVLYTWVCLVLTYQLSLGLGVPSLCHSLTIPELRCQIAGMFGIPMCWANRKWLSQNTHLGTHNRFILCGAVNRDASQMIQSVFVLHPLPSPVHSVADSSWIQE